MTTKRCPDCGLTKEAADWGRNRSNADGLASYCTLCFRRRSAEGYARRREAAGKEYRPRVVHPEGFKRCADCREVKPLEDFDRAKSQSGGRNCYCKPCRRRRESDARFLKLYRLSREALDQLKKDQGGLCAICREGPPEHVDHDHLMGHVRGVLCSRCNTGLGQFRDRTDLLRTAIDYLERTTWQRQRVEPGVYRLTSPRRAARPSPSSSRPLRPTSSRHG